MNPLLITVKCVFEFCILLCTPYFHTLYLLPGIEMESRASHQAGRRCPSDGGVGETQLPRQRKSFQMRAAHSCHCTCSFAGNCSSIVADKVSQALTSFLAVCEESL